MNVGLLAATYAIIAEVEGMKAENMQRQACGSSMAYGDNDFFDRAKALDAFSKKEQKVVVKNTTTFWNIPNERAGDEAVVKGFFQHCDGDIAFPVVAIEFEDGFLAWASLDEVTILK